MPDTIELELARRCAAAMGLKITDTTNVLGKLTYAEFILAGPYQGIERWMTYDPFQDDAQAMALVKRFGLAILHEPGQGRELWRVTHWRDGRMAVSGDLNRAIVECAAQFCVTVADKP